MTYIQTLEELEALYGTPAPASLSKVEDHITPEYRAWINASPFCAIATVGPEGVDASPRGEPKTVVFELDDKTLALPDRRGNNRVDTLRNIVQDNRISLMLMIPNSGTVIRVNGTARICIDVKLLEQFTINGQPPRSVILVDIVEIYFQCAKSVLRSGLWDESTWGDVSILPSVGDILKAASKGKFGGKDYDKEWPSRAKATLW